MIDLVTKMTRLQSQELKYLTHDDAQLPTRRSNLQ